MRRLVPPWRLALSFTLAYAAEYDLTILDTGMLEGRQMSMNIYDSDCSAKDSENLGGGDHTTKYNETVKAPGLCDGWGCGNCKFGNVGRRAGYIDRVRSQNKNTLLVDTGMAVWGSINYLYHAGKASAELNSMLEYDVMAVGARMFATPMCQDRTDGNGRECSGLTRFLDWHKQFGDVKFVTSNMNLDGDPELKKRILPWHVKVLNGRKIGILGVQKDSVIEQYNVPHLRVNEPFGYAEDQLRTSLRALKTAHPTCNIIICIGYGESNDVTRNKEEYLVTVIEEIDIFISAGQYKFSTDKSVWPKKIIKPSGSVGWITSTHWRGMHVGHTDVTFDDDGHIVRQSDSPVRNGTYEIGTDTTFRDGGYSYKSPKLNFPIYADEFDNETWIDPLAINTTHSGTALWNLTVWNRAKELEAQSAAAMETQYGKIKSSCNDTDRSTGKCTDGFDGQEGSRCTKNAETDESCINSISGCRWMQCPVGTVVTAALLNHPKCLDCDVAFVNGGGIRDNIPGGNVTLGTCKAVHPYSNVNVRALVQGSVLKAIIEAGARESINPTSTDKLKLKGGFLQVGGARYAINAQKTEVMEIEVYDRQKHLWFPIDETREYTIVTSDYVMYGQLKAITAPARTSANPKAKLFENIGNDAEGLCEYIRAESAAGGVGQMETKFTSHRHSGARISDMNGLIEQGCVNFPADSTHSSILQRDPSNHGFPLRSHGCNIIHTDLELKQYKPAPYAVKVVSVGQSAPIMQAIGTLNARIPLITEICLQTIPAQNSEHKIITIADETNLTFSCPSGRAFSDPPSVFFGPSEVTALAKIMSASNQASKPFPVMSYQAVPDIFSEAQLYPLFLRMQPSRMHLADAMEQVVRKYNSWNRMSCVYFMDESNEILEAFKKRLASLGKTVVHQLDASKESASEIVDKLKKLDVRVVFLDIPINNLTSVVTEAKRQSVWENSAYFAAISPQDESSLGESLTGLLYLTDNAIIRDKNLLAYDAVNLFDSALRSQIDGYISPSKGVLDWRSSPDLFQKFVNPSVFMRGKSGNLKGESGNLTFSPSGDRINPKLVKVVTFENSIVSSKTIATVGDRFDQLGKWTSKSAFNWASGSSTVPFEGCRVMGHKEIPPGSGQCGCPPTAPKYNSEKSVCEPCPPTLVYDKNTSACKCPAQLPVEEDGICKQHKCAPTDFTHTISPCMSNSNSISLTFKWNPPLNDDNQPTYCDGGVTLPVDVHNIDCMYAMYDSDVGLVTMISAVIGAILSVSTIVWIVLHRKLAIAKAAQIPFCVMFSLGMMASNLAQIVFLGPNTDLNCMLRPWLFHLFFTLAFSCLFVKVYRIHKLFNNKKLTASRIKNSQLYTSVAFALCFDCVILAVWSIADPITAETSTITEADTEIPIEICVTGQLGDTLVGVLAMYKIGIILAGCKLSYETRNVNPNFAEGKHIMFALYNVAIFGAITLLLKGMKIGTQGYLLLQSIVTTLSSCVALGCVYIPKMIAPQSLDPNRRGSTVFGGATSKTSDGTTHITSSDDSELLKKIETLEKENAKLRESTDEIEAQNGALSQRIADLETSELRKADATKAPAL